MGPIMGLHCGTLASLMGSGTYLQRLTAEKYRAYKADKPYYQTPACLKVGFRVWGFGFTICGVLHSTMVDGYVLHDPQHDRRRVCLGFRYIQEGSGRISASTLLVHIYLQKYY